MKATNMSKSITLLLLILFSSCHLLAQTIAIEGSAADLEYQKEYNKNITLTKINGVYIPGSLEEAFKRINKLSPAESRAKFQNAPEKEVCKKLHFGLGRWMIEKWNFYGGSRISHLLKTKGLLHPDDMAQFLLRSYHRFLNELPLEEEALINELAIERKRLAREAIGM